MNNNTRKKERQTFKNNNQWGNLTIIRTRRGILLVDSKDPEKKRFFPKTKQENKRVKRAV